MRKRKTKNEIHIRFSKWCENEKRKLKFISVFQRDAKTKYEVQNRFSKLVENEKQKAKFKSVFQCHAKTKNGNGTWIPFSHAIEKRLVLRYHVICNAEFCAPRSYLSECAMVMGKLRYLRRTGRILHLQATDTHCQCWCIPEKGQQ